MGIMSKAQAEANGATARRRATAPSSGSSPTRPAAARSCSSPTPRTTPSCWPATTTYWGTQSPFPAITLKQVKDATAQLQQLQQGDVDIAMQISFDSVGQLDGVEGVTTEEVDSYNFVYLGMSPGAVGGEALKDPKVREAIKLALDYEGILDTTVGGNGKLQASPIPNGYEGSEGLPLPKQDVERAKQLLDRGRRRTDHAAGRLPDRQRLRRRLRHDDGQGPAGPQGDRRRAQAGAGRVRPVGRADPSDDGIPFTAVYFAPDHIDSSQYVQYFGMIDDAVVVRAVRARRPEPRRDGPVRRGAGVDR